MTQTKLITPAEVAEMLAVEEKTLNKWRSLGKGPKYVKLDPTSPRSKVRYKLADVEAWIRACAISP